MAKTYTIISEFPLNIMVDRTSVSLNAIEFTIDEIIKERNKVEAIVINLTPLGLRQLEINIRKASLNSGEADHLYTFIADEMESQLVLDEFEPEALQFVYTLITNEMLSTNRHMHDEILYCDSCYDLASDQANGFGVDGSLILASMAELLPDHLCEATDGEIKCACRSHG
jgi:hypothetical protein